MVEIGVTGAPFRASTIAAGAAMAAEADGAHAIWYPDVGPGSAAGSGARQVPVGDGAGDPTDNADPLITASLALLVARRVRVGILGWDLGDDAARAARAAATLADLAPGRVMLACTGPDSSLIALSDALRSDLDIELAAYGATPGPAAHIGWGWIGVGRSAESVGKTAGEAGVVGPIGIHLPVFVHHDGDLARRGASRAVIDGQLVDGRELVSGDGMVIGAGPDLDAAIDEYVSVGVTRIVIDNVVPHVLPEALESSQAVIRSCIRTARIRHRETEA